MDLVRPNTQEEVTSMKCSQCGTEMTVELTDVPAGWKQYDLLIRGVRTHACKACGHEVLEPQDARMVQELSRALSEMTEKPEILDVSRVADLLRVSIQTVYNQVKAGKLPAVKIGREWRFTRSAVMQMLTKTADASPNIAREAATTVYGAPEDAADAGTRPNAAEPTDPTA